MCLLFVQNPGAKIPEDKFKDGWDANPDGFGVMWADDGKIITRRSMTKHGALDIWRAEMPNDRVVVGHFRWKTHGDKDIYNVHPFEVTPKLFLAHNGVISVDTKNTKMSDTWHFAQLLKGVVDDIEDLHVEGMQLMISKVIGSSNKVAFMASDGRAMIFGKSLGSEIDDVWYSNTYAFGGVRAYWAGDEWDGYYSQRYGQRYGKTDNEFEGENDDDLGKKEDEQAQGDSCHLPVVSNLKQAVSKVVDYTTKGKSKVILPKKDPKFYAKNTQNYAPRSLATLRTQKARQYFAENKGKRTLVDLTNMTAQEMRNFVLHQPVNASELLYDLVFHSR